MMGGRGLLDLLVGVVAAGDLGGGLFATLSATGVLKPFRKSKGGGLTLSSRTIFRTELLVVLLLSIPAVRSAFSQLSPVRPSFAFAGDRALETQDGVRAAVSLLIFSFASERCCSHSRRSLSANWDFLSSLAF